MYDNFTVFRESKVVKMYLQEIPPIDNNAYAFVCSMYKKCVDGL